MLQSSLHCDRLATLRAEKFKISDSDLQGESQVYVFHLLVEVGFLPFYEHIDFLSFTWYLVAAESSIWKQSNLQDVRQDSELCRWGLEKCRLISPT